MPNEGKKPTKSERRAERLRKGQMWVVAYEGNHIVRDYSRQFKVDALCAMDDVGKIGAIAPEKLAAMKLAEIQRREKWKKEREKRRLQEFYDSFPVSDNRFFCIIGYTSGGAPYGVTWEEMGVIPWESQDEFN